MPDTSSQEIEDYLHEQIPATRFMGIRLVSRSPHEIRFRAPLEPNLNHRKTAFGGSIATMGILAGWAFIHFNLQEMGLISRVVIKKSAIDFLEPMLSDFEASCHAPHPEKWETFLNNLKQYKMAQIELATELFCREKLSARHQGVYVARLNL